MNESLPLFGFGLGAIFLVFQLLKFCWYVAVLVLLYKIWQKVSTLPSVTPPVNVQEPPTP